MVADVKKPCIDTVFEQPDMNVNWQRIYSKPNTLLARISDTLFCPKGVTYRWLFNNDTIPNVVSPTYKPTQSGLYRALVQYPGYPSESKDFNFTMTGKTEIQPPAGLRLYPNPAGDVICFEIPGNPTVSNGPYHIEIVDNLGKTAFSADKTDPGNRGSILLKELQAGFYVIRIRSQKTIFTKGFLHY